MKAAPASAAPDVAMDLRRTVEGASAKLLAIGDDSAALRPAPGKWSPKEIIGHLIDSAANNHPRFVRAQMQEDLVFPGYDQDEWVKLQRYQSVAWPKLVELWKAYNQHVAHVMETASALERTRPRARHNLHQIAWRTVDEKAPTTLEYFMSDYVAHLKHHLGQIRGLGFGGEIENEPAVQAPYSPGTSILIDLGVCVLRDWRSNDAPVLARHANNRKVWRNLRDRFPHPYSEDDARQFIDASLAMSPRTNFAITVGGEAIGSIGLILHDDIERISAELGYWLGEAYWGKGIAPVAVRAITRYAFEKLEQHRVFAIAYVWNPASARVLEKAGFVLEATMRKSAIKDGEVVDQWLYAITRE